MSIVQEKMKYMQKKPGFKIFPHPEHKRLYHIQLADDVIRDFLKEFQEEDSQRLEYVPYMRFIMAGKLRKMLGTSFVEAIRGILQDRNTGGFTIGVQGKAEWKYDSDYEFNR